MQSDLWLGVFVCRLRSYNRLRDPSRSSFVYYRYKNRFNYDELNLHVITNNIQGADLPAIVLHWYFRISPSWGGPQ